MTANWKNTTLGALCAVNPDKRGVDWPHSVIQYIDISSVGTGFFNTPPRAISLGEAPSRAQRLVEAEDTIISTVRPNRRSFLFLRCPTPNTVVSTGFCVLRAREGKVDPRFLYYLVNQESFTDYLVSRAEGSAYPAVNPSVLEEAEIRVPPYPEQRAIARVLGALDDKIEINRKMNETLESIAQTLFQSWFIDFTPVHAKSKGRNRSLPPQIANLFPSEFEDSPLGQIPKGWKIGSLGDLAQLRTEAAQPYRFPEEIWEHYSIPAYDDSRLPVIEPGASIKSGKYLVPETAVLISRLNPQFPRVWLPAPSGAHRPICSTELLPFVPRQPRWRPYLYNLALSSPFQAEVANRVTGTTGSRQRVKPAEIAAIPLPLPPPPICATFSAMASPLSARAQDNLREAQSLSATRDELLPKLLSGQFRL